jgi:hypothetical protein
MSFPPPGGKGMMNRMGRDGKVSADAIEIGLEKKNKLKNKVTKLLAFISPPFVRGEFSWIFYFVNPDPIRSVSSKAS